MNDLLIDVRTREEFVKEHIKGAINIPHYDLGLYSALLEGKGVTVYCNTERRSEMAKRKLAAMGIGAKSLTQEEQDAMEWVQGSIVCAQNYVSIRPGHEEAFMKKAMDLCRATEGMDGFLGSKALRASGMSAIGSFVKGDLTGLDMKPTRMVLVTFWTTKEAHERSHLDPSFKATFESLAEHLTEMPVELFYEVLK